MSSLRVFGPADCDIAKIQEKRIAVVGYGSQGRAFALNLVDSGCNVQVILREESPSRRKVSEDWLPVAPPEATADHDIIILAIPDHEQISFFQSQLESEKLAPKALIFLHGSNFHFKNLRIGAHHDVILVAPHGPGTDLRNNFVQGNGLSCFLAVGQNSSGEAKEIGLAIAGAIGAAKAGIFETTFRDETIGDLFGEQTLLVGGLAGMTTAVFETMISHGISPENAYLETIKQLKLLASMIESYGPAGMVERVSKTAAYGSALAIGRLFDGDYREKLESIYSSIESGEFNKLLLAEARNGFADFEKRIQKLRNSYAQRISDSNHKTE